MELLQREVDSTHTECWVGSLDEIAHEDQRVARVAQLMDAPFVMERARRMVPQHHAPASVKPRAVQLFACWIAVTRFETSGNHTAFPRRRYATFAHVRPDLQFFQRLPVDFLLPYAPSEVRVPAGDDWGSLSRVTKGEVISGDLSFGGAAAFSALSHQFQLLVDPEQRMFDLPWIGEAFWWRALNVRGILNITRLPLAYCKADALLLPAAAHRSSHLLDRSRIIAGRSNCQEDCQVAGCGLVTVQLALQSLRPAAGATTCRYFGQLAQSVHLVPSLLHCKPEIFQRLCESHAGPTSSVVQQGVGERGPPPGLYPQTAADRARDPNWLHLARLVDRADVCPRYGGWGAKTWLAH